MARSKVKNLKSRKLRFKFNSNAELKLFILHVSKLFKDHEVVLDSSINTVDIEFLGPKQMINSVADEVESFALDIQRAYQPNPKGERLISHSLLQLVTKGSLALKFLVDALLVLGIDARLKDNAIITTAEVEFVSRVYRQTFKLLQGTAPSQTIDVRKFVSLIQLKLNLPEDQIYLTAEQMQILERSKTNEFQYILRNDTVEAIDAFLLGYKEYLDGEVDQASPINIENPFFDGGKVVFLSEDDEEIDDFDLDDL